MFRNFQTRRKPNILFWVETGLAPSGSVKEHRQYGTKGGTPTGTKGGTSRKQMSRGNMGNSGSESVNLARLSSPRT